MTDDAMPPESTRSVAATEPARPPAPNSLSWLPVVTGLGGIVLCALVLVPILFWYRADYQQHQATVDKLNADLEAASKTISQQKQDNSDREKAQADSKTKAAPPKPEDEAKLAAAQKTIDAANKEIERLKQKDVADEAAIQTLNRQLNEAIASAQKAAGPSVPPPNSTQKTDEANAQLKSLDVLPRLPDPALASARMIDLPSKPTKIELVGVPKYRIANKQQDQWEIQQGEKPIATLNLAREVQPPALKFLWARPGKSMEDLQSMRKELSGASLNVTLESGEIIVVPLHYALAVFAPAKR